MTDKSDIEALACDIYNAHRTERIIAGAKNVASWWGMDARNREHWMKVARRLQPARVPDGWVMVPREPTPEMCKAIRMCDGIHGRESYREMLAAAPQPEAAQPAGEGGRCNAPKDGRTCYPECSCESEHLCEYTPEPAPSAPADVEADIQKLESYLDDAGYPKDGDAQLTLESLAARLASAPQPTQRGGEGVEAVKQSLTGGGKNE